MSSLPAEPLCSDGRVPSRMIFQTQFPEYYISFSHSYLDLSIFPRHPSARIESVMFSSVKFGALSRCVFAPACNRVQKTAHSPSRANAPGECSMVLIGTMGFVLSEFRFKYLAEKYHRRKGIGRAMYIIIFIILGNIPESTSNIDRLVLP